ncbi:MAG: fibronectin type III domain-containing protein [Saprospiraceae bacterium]
MQAKFLRILFILFLGNLSYNAGAQSPSLCVAPSITTIVPDSNKVIVNWVSNTITTIPVAYVLEYTAAPQTNQSNWTSVTITTPGLSFVVNGLDRCKVYIFRMKAYCAGNTVSSFSSYKDVKTLGCSNAAVCNAPVISTVVSDSTKATVSWGATTAPPAVGNYTLQYTPSPMTNTSVWTSVNTSNTNVTVTGLQTCKVYLYRVKSNCSSALSSPWSTVKESKTKGCPVTITCATPAIGTITTDSTKATINWSSAGTIGAAASYSVEYTPSPLTNNSVWTSVSSTSTSTTITGLQMCTGYLFRVKANCSPTLSSAYSSVKDSKTKGCAVVVPCTVPSITNIVADSTKATAYWTSTNTTPGVIYTLEYTAHPQTASSVWSSVTTSALNATVSGLQTCAYYIFRVKANCSSTQSSAFSSTREIKTKGCAVPCNAPVISTIAADSSKVTVMWTISNSGISGSYTLEYTASPVTNTSVWTSVNTTTNTFTVTGLQMCTGYLFRVKTNCSPTSSSPWSSIRDIKTKGCVVIVPCTTPVIGTVTPDSTKATLTWSNAGTIGASSYTVEYAISQQSSPLVWTAVNTNSTSITITGLQKCTGYLFRVKANCSTTSSSAWSSIRDTKTKGCVVVVPCSAPVIGNVYSDSTKATINWASVNSTTVVYTVEYTMSPVSSTSVWISASVTGTTFTATGLTKCKEYVFRVKSNCSATSSSAWSKTKGVVTKGCPTTSICVRPYNLNNAVSANGVLLTWLGSGIHFQVRYKKVNNLNGAWTVVDSIKPNSLPVAGLSNCTRYIWQVRALCTNSVWSSWSDTKVFGTIGCPTSQSLVISPNPGSQFNLFYTLESEAKVSFDIVDLQGRVIKQYDAGIGYAGDNSFNTETIDIISGLYFVVLKVDGVQYEIQRWIKE